MAAVGAILRRKISRISLPKWATLTRRSAEQPRTQMSCNIHQHVDDSRQAAACACRMEGEHRAISFRPIILDEISGVQHQLPTLLLFF